MAGQQPEGVAGPGAPLPGVEAELSQLSEEERRQIAAVMSRAQQGLLPTGTLAGPTSAEPPSPRQRHALPACPVFLFGGGGGGEGGSHRDRPKVVAFLGSRGEGLPAVPAPPHPQLTGHPLLRLSSRSRGQACFNFKGGKSGSPTWKMHALLLQQLLPLGLVSEAAKMEAHEARAIWRAGGVAAASPRSGPASGQAGRVWLAEWPDAVW